LHDKSDMEKESERELAIREIRQIIEKQADTPEPPRAIGGPFSLTPEQMLREVEENTEIGRKIVESFSKLRQQFHKEG